MGAPGSQRTGEGGAGRARGAGTWVLSPRRAPCLPKPGAWGFRPLHSSWRLRVPQKLQGKGSGGALYGGTPGSAWIRWEEIARCGYQPSLGTGGLRAWRAALTPLLLAAPHFLSPVVRGREAVVVPPRGSLAAVQKEPCPGNVPACPCLLGRPRHAGVRGCDLWLVPLCQVATAYVSRKRKESCTFFEKAGFRRCIFPSFIIASSALFLLSS